jgi:hypothetical protein
MPCSNLRPYAWLSLFLLVGQVTQAPVGLTQDADCCADLVCRLAVIEVSGDPYPLLSEVMASIRQGQFPQAAALAEQKLIIAEAGPDVQVTVAVLAVLADLYHSHLMQPNRAEEQFRRGLALSEALGDQDGMMETGALERLARFLRSRGRQAESQPLMLRYFEIKAKFLLKHGVIASRPEFITHLRRSAETLKCLPFQDEDLALQYVKHAQNLDAQIPDSGSPRN